MYLKSLNLFGFKSFGERTQFEFGRGVTAIVGPNGCGKSNVLDSLKWVLGEQSAKSLRGGEMLDVIFNGSGNRKPLGFSEVSLIFGDVGSTLGVDYDEVMVTRRLYRTGDSEYEMNKSACRLRDIRELFMDTGVGVVAYSIIEQGRIDALLTANSQERRHIFEEAAGISRYKWKAAEAGRRLERVDQNLARLTDLVQELTKQLGTVQRQAARAKRYTELTARQRDLRVSQALHRFHKLHAESADVSGRLALLTEEKARALAADSQRQTAVAREDEALLELTRRLQEAQGRVERAASEIAASGKRIEANRQLAEDSRRREDQLLARAAEARDAAERLCREGEGARARLAEARVAETEAAGAVAAAEATAAAARAARDSTRTAVESATAALFEGEREASDARNARDRAASDATTTTQALEKALGRRGEVAGRRDAAEETAAKVRAE
ncbi:MAG: AAA family ATPase, partial [Planctomycetales bacterium]|nr:AAA family ATPase [Planctomycetales bacterium]